ncbi:MAG: hypothetical protein WCF94_03860 [bacterium]
MKTKLYPIPCLHEAGKETNWHKTVPDYYPLSKGEIAQLLDEAKTVKHLETAQILCRLHQGVIGKECPDQAHGPIAEKMERIANIYWGNLEKGASDEIVDEIHKIMVS